MVASDLSFRNWILAFENDCSVSWLVITEISFKITCTILQPYLPGDNKLMNHLVICCMINPLVIDNMHVDTMQLHAAYHIDIYIIATINLLLMLHQNDMAYLLVWKYVIGVVVDNLTDALSTFHQWSLECQWHCQPCTYGCSSVSDTVNPAPMDAPVSVTLSILHLWMLQCQWHCQPCTFGCSSVSNTVNPAPMDDPVSVTLSTLHLWMIQCQWHCQPCTYGGSSVSDTVNPAPMDDPVSVTLSTLHLWMIQCQWHCQPCTYGWSSVSDTVNPAPMDDPLSVTLSTLHLWMLQCQ